MNHSEATTSERTPRSEDVELARVFPGNDEISVLCRAKDWARTPLGHLSTWPQSLRTAVSIVQSSAFPMVVLWGPQLIQIYNAAYRLIMGEKHPGGLGQANRECWPEAWAINESIYPRIFAGENLSFREAKYPLAPHGIVRDFYLTLSYGPVRDEKGDVGGVFVTVFDVTGEVRLRDERDRAVAQAERARAQLYGVFMQAPAIIGLFEGEEHVITVANPRYLEIVGNRDVIGKPFRVALPEVAAQGFDKILDGVRATGEPFVAHDALVKVDRKGNGVPDDVYVDFIYQPLKGDDGAVYGILAHAVETTEQVLARMQTEQRNAELTRLSQALAETNRDLDQFAYVASHDLKAPLRGIANLAQWIEEDLGGEISRESAEHMRLLHRRVQRLEMLIDGILEYSRAGRVRVKPERVDVGSLVRDVLELLAAPAEVRFDVQSGLPTVTSERVPLQQVILNLVSNAIKFTAAHRSDPLITIRCQDLGDSIEISVRDNGPGIPAEYRERIWEIFQTLEARDKVEGTGIGLAVVKKMVESRGGRVGITASSSEGTTFSFTWRKVATVARDS